MHTNGENDETDRRDVGHILRAPASRRLPRARAGLKRDGGAGGDAESREPRRSSESINYKDSDNLKYDGANIHPFYNTRVQDLDKSIRTQLNLIGL